MSVSDRDENRREELLAELLEHGPEGAGAEARDLLQSDEDFAEEFAQVKRLASALDAGANLEREILAEALGGSAGELSAAPRDDAAAETRPETQAQPEPKPAPGKLLRGPWWIAAAAAVFAAFLIQANWPTPDPAPTPETLGDGIELLEPLGPVEAYDAPFRWTLESGLVRFSMLQIFADDGGAPGEPLTAAIRVLDSQWTPDPSESAAWPDRIHWVLTPYDGSGHSLDPAQGEAWLAD